MNTKHIRLASSPWGFRQTPLENQCAWLAEQGFQYICGQFFDAPGCFPLNPTPEELAAGKKLTQSQGLSYASVNVNGDFTVHENVDAQIALACRDVDNAATLQPEVLIIFAGWENRDDQAVYDQASAALKQIAQYAAKYKLPLALENHGGVTSTIEQCNRLLAGADEPNLGLNYDPANFAMHGEDPLRALQRLEHPIVFTHFKSLKRVGGKKEYCRLCEGEIDYPPILRLLRDRGYDGFYTLEYEEPSDVFAGTLDDRKSLFGWLEKI
ncbi:MAG: sugar phosphate isomerase/epimerase [Phycisphaerae bacterium]|nr:sugar phosphate isomerase/epimerase [Phycisphaerae bacterium]